MRKSLLFLMLLIFIGPLFHCTDNTSPIKTKLALNDPFSTSMATSQFFNLVDKTDNIIEGSNGTILIFQKDCFLDIDGNIVNRDIKIELTEALSLNEMLLSNLTTASNSKMLETDGMIFLNATANGEQLIVNKDKPIYVEIPTKDKKPDMMVYKGERDSLGNMNWVTPQELDKSLIPIDIYTLDFLPDGFETEVYKGMPFRNYKAANKSLVDSLYYFHHAYVEALLNRKEFDLTINEPYYQNQKLDSLLLDEDESAKKDSVWGVDPLIIKSIKTDQFQNTLIATREFTERLQVIFKICRTDIIQIYINNLDKNLWELDSIVSNILGNEKYNKVFDDFSKQKKTQVKGFKKNALLLRKYYEKRLKAVREELDVVRKNEANLLTNESKETQKILDSYKKVLFERERFRMETYGFEQTSLGWVNIDRGIEEKDWESQRLEVNIQNVQAFDNVYTYVLYKSIKSLYRLNSQDSKTFYVGTNTEREILIPKKAQAIVISIGYKNGNNYLAFEEFTTNLKSKFDLTLKSSSKKEINKFLLDYDSNDEGNSIQNDLEFMYLLSKERKKEKNSEEEFKFLRILSSKIYPPVSSTMQFDQEYKIDVLLSVCDPYPIESEID